jgi:hypothetical protein
LPTENSIRNNGVLPFFYRILYLDIIQ